jgi:serine/threonine protein kinase/formylglycine-generating enzyme required for sulfatase activity
MLSSDPTTVPSPAERVFAEFASFNNPLEERAFDALCTRHSDLIPELLRLRGDWRALCTVLERNSSSTASPGSPLFSSVGAGAPGPSPEMPRATSELLRRLESRVENFERYRVRGVIAEGGMGIVLKVWDEDLRRTLAMKVIGGTRSDGRSPRALTRFLEEAQVLGQLDHPGIVGVHEIGVGENGKVYFTMPLVRGRDFKQIIDLVRSGSREWTLARALGVLVKVCEALAYAHSKGVLHRDLKPTNIMVGLFGETFVMDWGLARVIGDPSAAQAASPSGVSRAPFSPEVQTERSSTRRASQSSSLATMDGDVIGTPPFMAPEQALGKVEAIGPRSEVYAVGAMLYQLLTGRMPYRGDDGENTSAHGLLTRLLAGPPLPVREVCPEAPAELAAICEKAMARRKEDRYVDMTALARDIESYLTHRPTEAFQPPAAHRPAHFLRLSYLRHRGAFATAAAALLLLLACAFWFVLDLRQVAARERGAHEATRELLDRRTAVALVGEEPSLHPAVPSMAPSMREWIAAAGRLIERKAGYAARYAAGSQPGARDEDGANRGQPEELASLLSAIDSVADLLPAVQERLAKAETLAERTLVQPRTDWDAAIEDIAADPIYAGLCLRPQLGLVPLQKNPRSGLWEFWHVLSGVRPAVSRGEVVATPESGIVLVLLPGGAFPFGSPADEAGRLPNEGLEILDIEPFFLSKLEATRAQWERVLPSHDEPLSGAPIEPDPAVAGLYPVESVSWYECQEVAKRLALELPNEMQWEYACRAGAATAWSFGGEAQDLEGRENIADASAANLTVAPAAWNDGNAYLAPVGSYAANRFGLFDMHGNVSEWCEDWYSGEINTGQPRRKNFRGGSWYLGPLYCRAAFRQYDTPKGLNFARGVRLARAIE